MPATAPSPADTRTSSRPGRPRARRRGRTRLRRSQPTRAAHRRASRARRSRRPQLAWAALGALGLLVASGLVAQAAAARRAAAHPAVGEHWHGYLAVNVCGRWLDPAPAFEPRADRPGVNAGLHSHGDGLMHAHPFASDEAGAHATVGQFLTEGGWSASPSRLALWDEAVHRAGAACTAPASSPAAPAAALAGPARITWKAAPVAARWPRRAQHGDVAEHRIVDDEVVAVYYGPPGMATPRPPGARAALAHLTDVAPTGPTGPTG